MSFAEFRGAALYSNNLSTVMVSACDWPTLRSGSVHRTSESHSWFFLLWAAILPVGTIISQSERLACFT